MRKRPRANEPHNADPAQPIPLAQTPQQSPPRANDSLRNTHDLRPESSFPSSGPASKAAAPRVEQKNKSRTPTSQDERESRPRQFVTERLGVWEVEREVFTWRDYLPFHRFLEDWRELRDALPYVWRFVRELAHIGPHLTIAYLLLRIAQTILPAYKIRANAYNIHLAQRAVDERALDIGLIGWAFARQCALVIITRCLDWSISHISNALSHHLKRIFDAHTMRARFQLDLPSLEDENIAREMRLVGGPNASEFAWRALRSIINSGSNVIETGISFVFLLGLLRDSRSDHLLACVALLKPVLEMVVSDKFTWGDYWAKIVDPWALRAEKLKSISTIPTFFKDIIALCLGDHITTEFVRASDLQGGIRSTRSPFEAQVPLLSPGLLLLRISEDLPLFMFALQASRTPKSIPMSFATFTLIKQTTGDFSRKLISLTGRGAGDFSPNLAQHAGRIRALYEGQSLPVQIQDGKVDYERRPEEAGMEIELRNVSFSYPGGTTHVLKHINCTFPRGKLVIVYGENGGGKSTLVKLLSRLYDTTEGDILINGRSIRDYHLDSVRNAVAILWQDHVVLPLSIAENIGVGDISNVTDLSEVHRAAKQAGCFGFIDALPRGFQTMLGPIQVGRGRVRSGLARRPAFMRKKAQDQEREVVLSGGQFQKLALARVLMRQEKADLFIFDEPSASLDARAERELFLHMQSLRNKGKTIIWISHRLHLARSADLVAMMHDGCISEMNTPDQLLSDPKSAFAELYRFQES